MRFIDKAREMELDFNVVGIPDSCPDREGLEKNSPCSQMSCSKCWNREMPVKMNIYQQAINKFGEQAQMMIAVEEMSELTKEIIKHLRYGQSNIEEELADVKIMVAQLEEMTDKELVKRWTDKKLERLEGLVNA